MLAELHPRLPTLIERTVGWMARRRAVAAVVAASALCAVAAVLTVSRVDADAPLFDTELHAAQTAEVEDALTLWGESYRANASGTQIWVAAARRRDLLLRLTLAGLPRRYIPTSSDVLEDQSNALTPQSIIDDRRRSGIEGDVVAGLRRIAGVADAIVVLPPTSSDPLGDDPHNAGPMAAVQLVMQPGAQLSTESVAGIRRFVAAAYPGLSPERVTVVDGSGAVFGTPAAPDAALAKERRVQGAVQSALDAVLGPGAAVVRVSVRTNGSEQQSQSTRVVPHGALSADVARERGRESGKSFDKERTVRRFAYDTLSERKTTPADAQAKLSIAVFLDTNRVGAGASGSIASLVRAAAGADLRAGDDVVVDTLPFVHPSPSPHIDAAQSAGQPKTFAPAVVACAIALFGVASLPRFVSRGVPAAQDVRLERTAPPEIREAASAFEALAGESPQAAAYVIASLSQEVRLGVLQLCETERRCAIESYLRNH